MSGFISWFRGQRLESGNQNPIGLRLKIRAFFYRLQSALRSDNAPENAFLEEIQSGELRITDLGYSRAASFVEIAETRNAYYLSRLKSSLPLSQKEEGGAFIPCDPLTLLPPPAPSSLLECEVWIRQREVYSPTRLVLEPVPPMIHQRRVRLAQQEARKKGHQLKQSTKTLDGFNLHLSNAPKEY